MKAFEELQQLWWQGPSRAPMDFDVLMKRIRTGKQELAVKFGWHFMAFAVGLAVLVFVWVTVNFATWTTHVAFLLMAACIFYAMRVQYRPYRELRWGGLSEEALNRPASYIAYLRQFQERTYRQHTRSFRVYGGCVGAALLLFSLEIYFAVPIGLFIGLSIFGVVWFLVSYFVFAKAYVQNEQRKIRAMIDDLEHIRAQMDEPDIDGKDTNRP